MQGTGVPGGTDHEGSLSSWFRRGNVTRRNTFLSQAIPCRKKVFPAPWMGTSETPVSSVQGESARGLSPDTLGTGAGGRIDRPRWAHGLLVLAARPCGERRGSCLLAWGALTALAGVGDRATERGLPLTQEVLACPLLEVASSLIWKVPGAASGQLMSPKQAGPWWALEWSLFSGCVSFSPQRCPRAGLLLRSCHSTQTTNPSGTSFAFLLKLRGVQVAKGKRITVSWRPQSREIIAPAPPPGGTAPPPIDANPFIKASRTQFPEKTGSQ